VTLTRDDIAALASPPEAEDYIASTTTERGRLPRSNTVRTVRGNKVSEWALQVNTPIGQDFWENITTVRVEDNRATGFASQLNYPMSMEAFLAVLQARGEQQLVRDQRQ